MNHSHRAALVLVLVLAASLRAQSETSNAGREFNGWIEQNRQKEIEDTKQLAREVNALLDNMQKFLLLGEAGQLFQDSQFVRVAENLEQSVHDFQRKPVSLLASGDALKYREALLDLGRVRAVMGDSDAAAKWVDLALNVDRERVRATLRGSAEDELDQVATLLKAANVYAASEKPKTAANRLDDALQRCTRPDGPLKGPGGDPLRAHCQLLKGSLDCADQSTASYRAALPQLRQALDVFSRQFPPASYPDGRPEIASARAALAAALVNLGEGLTAKDEILEARRCLEKQFPKGSPDLASLDQVLAQLHFQNSEIEAALEDVNEARKELLRCFPPDQYAHGHPQMIRAKTALATALNRVNRHDLALQFDKEALTDCQNLYFCTPRDERVAALLDYGQTLQKCQRTPEARRNLEDALAMARTLHPPRENPKGDALVAQCLLRLGEFQGRAGAAAGEWAEARETLRQAAEMYRMLPDGGPWLSAASCDLGMLALRAGDRAAAGRAFTDALEADRDQLRNLTRAAAEVEVLTFTRRRRAALGGYLTATRGAAETDEQTCAAVWASQGAVTRLAEARRLALRQERADSPEVRQVLEDLRDCYARLWQASRGGSEPGAIADLQQRRNHLEAQLSAHWPEPPSLPDYEVRGAADLAAKLPPRSAFIDFVLYDDPADGRNVQPCYTAFVVAAGVKPRRVDLGPAAAIDQVIDDWRQAVADWNPIASVQAQNDCECRSDRLAAELRQLVWEPLNGLLPRGTLTIYIAPDGDLARFPFSALPGDAPDAILLDECTVATVPNGPFLLDRLTAPGQAAARPNDFLAVGEVDYDAPGGREGKPFAFLPFSGEGLRLAERAVARSHARTLRKGDATLGAVCDELTRARQAHFSVHGFFEEAKWEKEDERLDEYRSRWSPDDEGRPLAAGSEMRYPLSYVGLALSGANGLANAERPGVLTGEEIADLRLDGLALVTLGACDTGLGKYTAGEGIEGIQRAFHLAGCRNVIATLWGVRDRATVVLMQEFYHQLWDNHRSSLEALREAQRTLYHHPDLLTAGGAPRGALTEVEGGAELALPPPARAGARRHAPVQSWAAFVHSGVGESVDVPLQAPVSAVSLMEETPAARDSFPWPWVGAGGAVLLLAAAAGWRRRARRASRSVPAPVLLTATLVSDEEAAASLVDEPLLTAAPVDDRAPAADPNALDGAGG